MKLKDNSKYIYKKYKKYKKKCQRCSKGGTVQYAGYNTEISIYNYRLGENNNTENDEFIYKNDIEFINDCKREYPLHCIITDLNQYYPGPITTESSQNKHWKILRNVTDGHSFYHSLLRSLRSKKLTSNLERLNIFLSDSEYNNISALRRVVLLATISVYKGGNFNGIIPQHIIDYIFSMF